MAKGVANESKEIVTLAVIGCGLRGISTWCTVRKHRIILELCSARSQREGYVLQNRNYRRAASKDTPALPANPQHRRCPGFQRLERPLEGICRDHRGLGKATGRWRYRPRTRSHASRRRANFYGKGLSHDGYEFARLPRDRGRGQGSWRHFWHGPRLVAVLRVYLQIIAEWYLVLRYSPYTKAITKIVRSSTFESLLILFMWNQ